jgi:hypothetical protein
MARRTGKAATRRARQQRRARQGPAPAPTAPRPTDADGATEAVTSQPTAPAMPSWTAYGGSSSRLAETAREEYHYVGRDLRNTAILTLIMAALLAGAVLLVNLSGVAPG